VRITGSLAAGDAVSALCAASSGAALLVVGDAGRAGDEPLGRTSLGCAGHQVAAHTSVPVVVVRGRMPGEHRPIVVGADGSSGAETAVGLAFAEAGLRECPLIAVFAYGQPAHPWAAGTQPTGSAALAALDESLLPWRDKFPRVSVEATTTDNEPTPALVTLSRDAQLVVVGAHGSGDSGSALGSVPRTVLDRAHCPVLISR
jgi:nucleotide-binding universal stress UspA family protein